MSFIITLVYTVPIFAYCRENGSLICVLGAYAVLRLLPLGSKLLFCSLSFTWQTGALDGHYFKRNVLSRGMCTYQNCLY